jgi:hypothetical protein
MEDILRCFLITIADSQLAFSPGSERLNSIWHGRAGVHQDFESAICHSFAVERHRFRVQCGQARVLHHPGVDFVTMRSRLEDDPRKNNGLISIAVDQQRER